MNAKKVLALIVGMNIVSFGAGFLSFRYMEVRVKNPLPLQSSWIPQPGEKVMTFYRANDFGGDPYVTEVTEVKFGPSQSGVLVYSDDLPGVDLWWVKKIE